MSTLLHIFQFNGVPFSREDKSDISHIKKFLKLSTSLTDRVATKKPKYFATWEWPLIESSKQHWMTKYQTTENKAAL